METVKTAKLIDGGGWKLKRFVPASNKWHPATDQLVGSDEYGILDSNIDPWSEKFIESDFN
jgi:hypothetical protein